MKADLTRNTFRYWKHFTRVLMQQGRVQLDADWNEQAAILLHFFRSAAFDIIGPFGRPQANPGFDIRVLTDLNFPQPSSGDFALSAGHFFVSGILCENTPDPIVVYSPVLSTTGTTLTVTAETLSAQGRFLDKGEYLEIFDAANPNAYAFGVVSDISLATRALSISIIAGIADPIIKNSNAQPRARRALTYLRQLDFPMSKSDIFGTNTTFLIYIDVWERLITYREDDGIREIALGGPDTAARAKLIRQVKALQLKPEDTRDFVSLLQDKFQPHNRGYLRARVRPSLSSTDPCIISPTSRYRGPENQLYRVEVHTGGSVDPALGTAIPTFKWSREDGAVTFSILSGGGTAVVTLDSLGRDDRFGLAEGDWVEVLDDDYVLLNQAGTLLQVLSIDRSTMQVTLSAPPDNSVGKAPTKHPILRRWDQKQGDETTGGLAFGTDNAALIQESSDDTGWLDLEDGVQIQFQKFDQSQEQGKLKLQPQYRTGDYWLIPARTATGDVEWPTQVLKDPQGNSKKWVIARPPDGVNHYYAPLGTIDLDQNGQMHNILTPGSFPASGPHFP